MRRILVALDGSELAESIIPDAVRYAGPDGEIILVRDAGWATTGSKSAYPSIWDSKLETDTYLNSHANALKKQGVNAVAHAVVFFNPSAAISDTAGALEVDMIACATHGRGPFGRLIHGSVAWKTLAHSTVPVLVRHFGEGSINGSSPAEQAGRRIMVPLDGSRFAEMALPLAQQLAGEWDVTLHLVRVVATTVVPEAAYAGPGAAAAVFYSGDDEAAAHEYLERVAGTLKTKAHTEVLVGSPVFEVLIEAARGNHITDVVMSSHGHTGLARVILGSVADGLMQHLSRPIVIVPALAAHAIETAAAHEHEVVATRG
jgi:nucleotide-binding universal stress UspA family protein